MLSTTPATGFRVMGRQSIERLLAACLLAWVVACVPASAQSGSSSLGISGLNIRWNGEYTWQGLSFHVRHADPDWSQSSQSQLKADKGFPKMDSATGTWQLQGFIPAAQRRGEILFEETLRRTGERSIAASYTVRVPQQLPTREVYVQISIPVALGAGKEVRLNGVAYQLSAQEQSKPVLYEAVGRQDLELPAEGGVIRLSGQFGVQVMDSRQWGINNFMVRLFFPAPAQQASSRSLEFQAAYRPFQSEPISLKHVVHRGFADPQEADGVGGWTDQGPDNDLSVMQPGRFDFASVTFDVIDPAANGGRSVAVLGPRMRGGATDKAVLTAADLPAQSADWKNLYLLHAGAWLPKVGDPVGEVVVRYKDGTVQRHVLRAGVDVDNWWQPASKENAAVGWTGMNVSSPVGLYVSGFALEGKPIEQIAFENNGNALWMIVAASGSADSIPLAEAKTPLTVTAGKDWVPYNHVVDIEEGSVFDFSALNHMPAGKYGFITINEDGHFEFEGLPGERQKFWGVNFSFHANFYEKEDADKLAERLARSGYNTVRLHHLDRDLIRKSGPSWELDPDQLDKVNYLFAALKKRGIYISIDLFTGRRFSEEELRAFGVDPKLNTSQMRRLFKLLLPISDAAFQSWARYTDNLLFTVNPYTGLTWAEDPALIGICPVNEDSLDENKVFADRDIQQRYGEHFEQWLQQPGNGFAGKTLTHSERAAAFSRFLMQMHVRSDARMRDYLRERGVKAPLTGTNHHAAQRLAFPREHYDYVDNHRYWDHPKLVSGQWRLPYDFSQRSAVADLVPSVRDIMPTRIAGKPFAVTEFNFVRPNRYRTEGGVVMPAYASLQDWDALYNFEYATTAEDAMQGGVQGPLSIRNDPSFTIATDPVGFIADRLSALVFRRGDVTPARSLVLFAVDANEAFEGGGREFPQGYINVGLITRIGSRTGKAAELLASDIGAQAVVTNEREVGGAGGVFGSGPRLAEELLKQGRIGGSADVEARRFISETGQIELNSGSGTLKVVTPRSELFVLTPEQTLEGERVRVANGKVFGTVSVIAIDEEPIANSGRLLVAHVTDALLTGMRFADQDRRRLEDWGQRPFLVERGTAQVAIALAAPAQGQTWKAWAVDAGGKRLEEVSLRQNGSHWVLDLDTGAADGGRFAYELVLQ